MARPIFYNGTIKKLIAAFGTVFDDISIVTDHGDTIKVPIYYSPRDKFIAYFIEYGDLEAAGISDALPRMGFEITSFNFSPDRYSNPLSKMTTPTAEGKFTYSRMPYDLEFALYIGTIKFEDGLKIVEQILPFFTPELNITVKDKPEFGHETDVPILFNSIGYEVMYEGSFDTKRSIQWQLGFTMKGWLYGDTKQMSVIKKTIVDLNDIDFESRFFRFTSEIAPATAKQIDPHTIIDRIE